MRHLRSVSVVHLYSLFCSKETLFQLQVAEVFPLFSSVPKMRSLSEELAQTPLSTERDSSVMLLSAEDSSGITRQFPKLWTW